MLDFRRLLAALLAPWISAREAPLRVRRFETLGQYHDFWVWLFMSAPDRFMPLDNEVVDQRRELNAAFADLRSNFHLVRKNVKDERLFRIAEELVEMAFEAYTSGEAKVGAHILLECEGLVWKSKKQKIKYGVAAEQRAFGVNIVYADVLVSPYPYEGIEGDLGDDQRALLAVARHYCESYLSEWRDFALLAWVMESDGAIKRISPDPKEYDGATLPPLQRSEGACRRRAKQLAEEERIRACVVVNVIGAQGDGLISYDIEQRGHPLVSARQLFRLKKGPTRDFDPMQFHLIDPHIFDERKNEPLTQDSI